MVSSRLKQGVGAVEPARVSATLSLLFGKRNSREMGVEKQSLKPQDLVLADLFSECKYFAPILLDFRTYSE